jgi:hypothetical protein
LRHPDQGQLIHSELAHGTRLKDTSAVLYLAAIASKILPASAVEILAGQMRNDHRQRASASGELIS